MAISVMQLARLLGLTPAPNTATSSAFSFLFNILQPHLFFFSFTGVSSSSSLYRTDPWPGAMETLLILYLLASSEVRI